MINEIIAWKRRKTLRISPCQQACTILFNPAIHQQVLDDPSKIRNEKRNCFLKFPVPRAFQRLARNMTSSMRSVNNWLKITNRSLPTNKWMKTIITTPNTVLKPLSIHEQNIQLRVSIVPGSNPSLLRPCGFEDSSPNP